MIFSSSLKSNVSYGEWHPRFMWMCEWMNECKCACVDVRMNAFYKKRKKKSHMWSCHGIDVGNYWYCDCVYYSRLCVWYIWNFVLTSMEIKKCNIKKVNHEGSSHGGGT